MAKRIRPSASDLAVAAISPALIVLMLSSLVSFFLLCIAGGQYAWRTSYVWFMFILGAVFIARLAIEASRAYTTIYALLLGAASFLVLTRFHSVDLPSGALAGMLQLMVIGGIWWIADRVTFNCTLIDEDRDDSGRGLLDAATPTDPAGVVAGQVARQRDRRRRRGQRPGVSVLWLTVAALPLFSLGSWRLPPDSASVAVAKACLGVFLATAMMLLVTTSFLSTRRYLRQRQLAMPQRVAVAWLTAGAALVIALVSASFLVPLPGRWLAQRSAQIAAASPDQWLDASRWGWGDQPGRQTSPQDRTVTESSSAEHEPSPAMDGGDQQQSSASGDRSPSNNHRSHSSSEGAESHGDAGPASRSGGDSSGGDGRQPSQASQGDAAQPDNRSQTQQAASQTQLDTGSAQQAASDASGGSADSAGEGESPATAADQAASSADAPPADAPSAESQRINGSAVTQQPPQPSSLLSRPSVSLRSLLVASLLAGLLLYLWWFRRVIAVWWSQLLEWLRRRPAERTMATPDGVPPDSCAPPRPFASFTHPSLAQLPPRQAIIETFFATEAWYREAGRPRLPHETPYDFARRLAALDRRAAPLLPRLAEAYGRMAYAQAQARSADLEVVDAVWRLFQSQAASSAATGS